jgi:hypothetical protein
MLRRSNSAITSSLSLLSDPYYNDSIIGDLNVLIIAIAIKANLKVLFSTLL